MKGLGSPAVCWFRSSTSMLCWGKPTRNSLDTWFFGGWVQSCKSAIQQKRSGLWCQSMFHLFHIWQGFQRRNKTPSHWPQASSYIWEGSMTYGWQGWTNDTSNCLKQKHAHKRLFFFWAWSFFVGTRPFLMGTRSISCEYKIYFLWAQELFLVSTRSISCGYKIYFLYEIYFLWVRDLFRVGTRSISSGYKIFSHGNKIYFLWEQDLFLLGTRSISCEYKIYFLW